MRNPFPFKHYLEKKIVNKKSPDFSRAEFLITESKKSLEGLKKRVEIMGIDEYSAHSIIKDVYEVLMQSLRAQMMLNGLYASGNYAHESEVAYMQEMGFSEKEIFFVNSLRSSRNGITYYGKVYELDYAYECYNF